MKFENPFKKKKQPPKPQEIITEEDSVIKETERKEDEERNAQWLKKINDQGGPQENGEMPSIPTGVDFSEAQKNSPSAFIDPEPTIAIDPQEGPNDPFAEDPEKAIIIEPKVREPFIDPEPTIALDSEDGPNSPFEKTPETPDTMLKPQSASEIIMGAPQEEIKLTDKEKQEQVNALVRKTNAQFLEQQGQGGVLSKDNTVNETPSPEETPNMPETEQEMKEAAVELAGEFDPEELKRLQSKAEQNRQEEKGPDTDDVNFDEMLAEIQDPELKEKLIAARTEAIKRRAEEQFGNFDDRREAA